MSALEVLVSICASIVTVSGAVTVIWKILSKNIKQQFDELIETSVKELDSRFSQDLDSIKEKLDTQSEENVSMVKQVSEALLNITRDRINSAYEHYIKKDYIDAHTMFTLEEVYKSYVALGGNSFVQEQMLELRKLRERSVMREDNK